MMTTQQRRMSRLTAVTIFNRSIVLLKEDLHNLLVFALFEDVLFSCSETAGYVRFALFTSGYGYSPPSATLA